MNTQTSFTKEQKGQQRIDLRLLQPELDYMLALARMARLADEQGDLETARDLRGRHDQLYIELLRRLP